MPARRWDNGRRNRTEYTSNDSLLSGDTEDWEYEEVVLLRGGQGLGFSISGGHDSPHVSDDPSIYITKLIPGGTAALDGRLRVGDLIAQVNRVSVLNVTHAWAVETLRRAGDSVQLSVKRRRPPRRELRQRIELCKGSRGLGFSIAGGIGNQHIPGDNGIFVTKLMEGGASHQDGRLAVGDRLVAVDAGRGAVELSGVTHEEAVAALKAVQDRVVLTVSRRHPGWPPPPSDQSDSAAPAAAPAVVRQPSPRPAPRTPTPPRAQTPEPSRGTPTPELGRRTPETIHQPAHRSPTPEPAHRQPASEPAHHTASPGAAVHRSPSPMVSRRRTPSPLPSRHRTPSPLPSRHRTPSPAPAAHQPRPPAQHQSAPDLVRGSPAEQQPEQPEPGQEQSRRPVSLYGTADSRPGPGSPPTDSAERLAREPRLVTLSKAAGQGLGFNIVGGEQAEGIFVSLVAAGGQADRSGRVFRGDQILSVDGADLSRASHEQAAAALKGSGSVVELCLQYRPDQYNHFEARIQEIKQQMMSGTLRTTQKRSLYVRALFDYDPRLDDGLPSRGLAFSFGDILHVTNASDDQWWQARPAEGPAQLGIVPSRRRWERKLRARTRSVGFHGRAQEMSTLERKKKNFSFSRKFPFMKSREDVKSDDCTENDHPSLSPLVIPGPGRSPAAPSVSPSAAGGLRGRLRGRPVPLLPDLGPPGLRRRSGSTGSLLRLLPELPRLLGRRRSRSASTAGLGRSPASSTDSLTSGPEQPACDETPVLSYEPVRQVEVAYCRPVILLGALGDRITDDLLAQYPDDFGSCVPHTTRPSREGEADGRDYHFVSSRSAMERDIEAQLFVEAGQFGGHLYGTSLAGVREVAEEQRKHCILDVSGNAIRRLQAAQLFPIAVCVRPGSLQQLMEWNRRLTEEQARREYDKCHKLQTEFGEYLTAIVSGDTPEQVYERVKEVIRRQGTNRIWIPSGEEL